MKHLLLTTIAAVVLVGCGKSAPNGSIHDAAKVGNIELINQHLETGVDVNSKDEIGFTPLHYIASGSQLEIAKLLIDKGANVNAKDLDGGTPLHAATPSNQSTEIVQLLVQKGANVNAKNNNGETPLDKLGSSNWSTSTEDILRKNGGKTSQELESAEANTEASLEKSSPPAEVKPATPVAEAANSEADRMLFAHIIAAKNWNQWNINRIKMDFEDGADVNAKDDQGATPLHYAAYRGHTEIAELLISKGADLNTKDDNGETPLSEAEEVGLTHFGEVLTRKKETADLLRKHGGKTAKELKAEGK